MQENNTQVTQSISNPITQTEQPLAVQAEKSNNYLTILLSILLLISISIVGFFAFQTQRLNEELIIKNEELKQTTQNLIEPTVEPVETESIEVDATANWKTYTNTNYGFSFKYPIEATNKITNFTGSKFSITFNNFSKYTYTDLTVFVGDNWAFTNPKADTIKNFEIAGTSAYREDLPLGQNPPQTIIYFKNKGNFITLQLNKENKDMDIEKIFNQILSTFKFIN